MRRTAMHAAWMLLALGCGPAPAAVGQLPELGLEEVVSGLESPTAIVHAGDERLFVAERGGVIRVVRGGEVLPVPLLDLRDRVGSGGERGLLSLAFHPRWQETGWVFLHYTDRGGDTVLSRFSLSADPDVARPGTERVLLRAAQPFANHNGGQLHFGPDGYLYLGLGDGGSANDPQCNAQDLSTPLGKILRLDVDSGAGAPPFHAIPPDNPFAGRAGARPEIWDLGLRNPWRFSFDRDSGDLWVADVGQNQREEVDFEPAGGAGGRNYGWKLQEGTLCLGSTAGCGGPVPPCGSPAYTPPVLEYGHGGGRCSITGGYVYRGEGIAGLDGWYFYGDFCSGEVLAGRRQGSAWVSAPTGLVVPSLTTFGEDAAGEIYAAGLGGTLFRITGPAPPPPPPPPQACVEDDVTLCLEEDRFQVRASFRPGQGPTRQASARPLTADTGWFWFFDPANLELMVKVLDGCPVNGRYWVFAAGLTNVGNELTVVDTGGGGDRRYPRPAGPAYAPLQDTAAFLCP
jgi:glucose/arabinose dehydrogenase